MDIQSGKPYPAGALSNFAPRPFIVRGIQCGSMEGFVQGLKFKSPEMQKAVFLLSGRAAKAKGAKKNWKTRQTLWFQGQPMKRDSEEYSRVLDDAFEALFRNEKAKKALLDTGNANLTHSVGKNNQRETVLTASEFCGRLMKLRTKLQHAT